MGISRKNRFQLNAFQKGELIDGWVGFTEKKDLTRIEDVTTIIINYPCFVCRGVRRILFSNLLIITFTEI